MPYEIIWLPAAERALERMPLDVQDRIRSKIDTLRDFPRPAGAIKLSGITTALYRIRERTSRIFYAIEDQYLVVVIVDVGNRREIYRQLGRIPTRQELLAFIKDKIEQKK